MSPPQCHMQFTQGCQFNTFRPNDHLRLGGKAGSNSEVGIWEEERDVPPRAEEERVVDPRPIVVRLLEVLWQRFSDTAYGALLTLLPSKANGRLFDSGGGGRIILEHENENEKWARDHF